MGLGIGVWCGLGCNMGVRGVYGTHGMCFNMHSRVVRIWVHVGCHALYGVRGNMEILLIGGKVGKAGATMRTELSGF